MNARPAFDLLVTGGTVVLPDRELRADVGVKDGKVVALLAPGTIASAAETFDATGKHVLPGVIDIHFHVRAPAYHERGTVETETRAAAVIAE